MISLKKLKILTSLQKLPKNVWDLGKINGCQRLWKVAQSTINRQIWSQWPCGTHINLWNGANTAETKTFTFMDWIAYWQGRYACSFHSTKVLHGKDRLEICTICTAIWYNFQGDFVWPTLCWPKKGFSQQKFRWIRDNCNLPSNLKACLQQICVYSIVQRMFRDNLIHFVVIWYSQIV